MAHSRVHNLCGESLQQLSLPFLDLSLPFPDLSLPSLDLSLPFLDLSLPFLDLSLPFNTCFEPTALSTLWWRCSRPSSQASSRTA